MVEGKCREYTSPPVLSPSNDSKCCWDCRALLFGTTGEEQVEVGDVETEVEGLKIKDYCNYYPENFPNLCHLKALWLW